jgi:glycosyltransferase involved in cell wall biosynthesis
LVERLVSKGLKFKLFVIGDGYLKKRLIDDSKKRGLESYIAFLGRVSETEKFKLMKSSWTLVLPSGTEGLSITLIESMACCTPPVASKVGGVPELIDHEVNGFLFEANDFEAFCNYVERLLTNKSLAELLGENGLKKVKNQFTWENVTERIIRVFYED